MSTGMSLSTDNGQSAIQFNQEYMPGELIVKFKQGAGQKRIEQLTQSWGASSSKELMVRRKGIPSQFRHLKLHKSIHVEDAIAEFSRNPEVEYAHPNYIYRAYAVANDADYPSLWGLQNNGQTVNGVSGTYGKDINATGAWDTVTDCSSVIVAVVDTGVNYNHRDLTGNMWNGGPAFPNHGDDFIDNDGDPMDLHGHGTHVAGTIGSNGNDGVGICGVCWRVQIMAVRVLDATARGTTATIANGINFAVTNGAHIINLSLGGAGDSTLLAAIRNASTNGVIVVAAAGNMSSSSPSYPAAYTNTSYCTDCNNVISVGAIDQKGNLSSFSNYGTSWVDIAAPGVNILSLWPGQTVSSREDFNSWTRESDWGIGMYQYGSPSGTLHIKMLTNPAGFNSRLYRGNLNSAAYALFDLNIYAPDVATVSFLIDADLESGHDYVYFSRDLAGGRPSTLNSITRFSGTGMGIFQYDLTPDLGNNPSIGFIFTSDSSVQYYGAGIGYFDINRLYYNTTACHYLAGTSMAAPHVAGVAALCIAQYINKNGSYIKNTTNMTSIINSLLNNFDDYASLNGYISNRRMLNAQKAVSGI